MTPHETDGFHAKAPGLARALGFREAFDLLRSIPEFGLTEPKARALLLERNIIYRMSIGMRWSSTKRRLVEEFEYRATFTWFDLRPQHDAPRHHNGQVRQTLYIRQEHALGLGAKLGLTAAGTDVAPAHSDDAEDGTT